MIVFNDLNKKKFIELRRISWGKANKQEIYSERLSVSLWEKSESNFGLDASKMRGINEVGTR